MIDAHWAIEFGTSQIYYVVEYGEEDWPSQSYFKFYSVEDLWHASRRD